MARSDDELRREAARLASLDEAGRDLEWLVQALRLGDLARDNAEQLERLDHEWLEEYIRSAGGSDEGWFPGSTIAPEPVAT